MLERNKNVVFLEPGKQKIIFELLAMNGCDPGEWRYMWSKWEKGKLIHKFKHLSGTQSIILQATTCAAVMETLSDTFLNMEEKNRIKI